MRKVKGFSYDTEKDKDVIDHVDKQPNGSQYVWELVRKDIKGSDLETIVKGIIEKYLKEINLSASKEPIDADEIRNILNI